MRDLENITSYRCTQNELSYFHREKSPIENVSIIIINKKILKNRKKHNVFIQAQQPRVASRLSRFSKSKKQSSITKPTSTPELNKCTRPVPPRNRSGHGKDTKQNKYKHKQSPFQSKFTANVVSEHRFDKCLNPYNYARQTKFKIYRCQLGTAEDSCCCSCNSDAMFEVMKSLYDCYKKKNCENCDCILCGHLQREDRMLGEKKRSLASLSEQEQLLRAQAMKGLSLPEGKTATEKKLINKVRTDLGVPIEPKTKADIDRHKKAAQDGKLLPLEGRTPSEKEKILQDLINLGIPLPVGRTPSEKDLIAKLMGKTPTLAPSEQTRIAKAEGLFTTLKGKSPEEKEKILKSLAMKGLALPEGQSPSEKKLIDKVRNNLGLPVEPKNKAIRDKHAKAAKVGLLQPLEGKTSAEKENILKGQHDMGIPLPKGRTPSEKSLIAKIAASSRHPSKVAAAILAPSEQMRKAKAEGLLTTLKDKTREQREKILRDLANRGIPLPEGQSPSEKKLINKVRTDLGLPIEPKNKAIRNKHEQAALAGLLYPLEGKTPEEKERLLHDQYNMGIPLPVGRTPSEKSLIAKIAASSRHPSKVASAFLAPSEQMHRAKAEGLLTPLKDKKPKQREKILRALAKRGIPLPEGQSPSEKKLIDKVRADLGLPIEPKTKAIRDKHDQAALVGLLLPLEGKTTAQKEKLLRGQHNMGIPLPKGRTPSEKSLIAKIAASRRHPFKVASAILAPSEQMRKAKAEGLLTTLKDKTREQREKILRDLANRGIPLPEGQSPSEKKLINKVRADLGLPKEPKTKSIRDKHEKLAKAGLLQPLEGKTPPEKEKTLKGLLDFGIPLPEGRTPSEKALIAKFKASSRAISAVLAPSEQIRSAKAEGLLTTLKDKTPQQREKILRGLANRGIPLPEGQTLSEKKLINKVRADLGLPIEPKNKAIREKHDQTALAGLLLPLEGKTPAQKKKLLQGQHNIGIPLPVGRTPSEKSLIAMITAGSRHHSKVASPFLASSEQMRRAKAEGLLTPLKDKTPEKRENILRALANRGIPLPEGQSPSEKKLIDKVRADLGLPIEPKTKAIRDKQEKAALAGLLLPLEGKTAAQKEKILRGQHNMGIPLPVGRTSSEKSLIAKVMAGPRPTSMSKIPSKAISATLAPSEHMRRAKAKVLLTSLKGKTPEQRENILKALAMRGIPLPEGQSPSEKKLIDKVRADLGVPIEPQTKAIRDKHQKAALAGLLFPLEGKTPAQKEKLLRGQHNMSIPLPVGRTPSEKSLIAKIAASSRHPSKVPSAPMAPSDKIRKAKAEGLLTPLKGKTHEQKEKILKALAVTGLPLPEGQSPSEKKLIDNVRAYLGLPMEPKTKSIRDKHKQAAKAGLLQPLEGKTPAEKEKVLKGLHNMGIPLPKGRTPSEKSLIAKIAASSSHPSKVASAILAPSEQMRRAKVEGLLTPLKDKTPQEREKILRALANRGMPLPEGQSPSEKKLINKVRADLGLPIEPKTKSIRDKHDQSALAGLLLPLEGKTPAQKEKLLRGQHKMGIPLPVGRTPSEKSLIAKIAASSRHPFKVASAILAPLEKMRRAKAEGLLTPLKNKTPEKREKILRALAERGIPLPEGQSPSEKKLIDKVRADLGLPIEPKTKSVRVKHEQAAKAGLLQPLEGKTLAQKEKLLRGQHNMGIPLPVGRTTSEKSLIAKIAAVSRHPSKMALAILAPSEQMHRAKAEELLTPLKDKTPEERENILRALAERGIPLPEGQSPSEKKLINKVRADLGLPIEPKTKSIRDKHDQSALAGLLLPLEGKTPAQKEKLLRGQHNMGIPLPVGRTPSEKSLIAKIAASSRHPSKVASAFLAPSEQMHRAKAEGLLTPLKDKKPKQREKILRALAKRGIPLPEGQSPSEKKLIDKVRADLGLPIEPKTKAIRDKHERAAMVGKLLPLEGKTPAEKERILQDLHDMSIPLPEGRTVSEKTLIAKIMAGPKRKSVGVSELKQLAARKETEIATEYQDIIKTTTCDRGCGCDKKKIRFKHSYVKIRVTSPDISTLCDCPGECIPGVKNGAFIDNEAIKVTVGRAVGIPSFTREFLSKTDNSNTHTEHKSLNDSIYSKYKVSRFESGPCSDGSYSGETSDTRPYSTESEIINQQRSTPPYEGRTSKSDRTVESLRRHQPIDDNYKGFNSKTKSAASSHDPILVIKSEMSLCSTSTSKSMDTVSLMSIMDSSITFNSTHYSGYQSTDDPISSSALDEPTTSDDLIDHPANIRERKILRNVAGAIPHRGYTVLRMSQTKLNFGNNNMRTYKLNSETEEPIVLCNQLPSKLDVSKIMDKIMSKKRFLNASAIFIVVPMSDDDEEQSSSNCVDSVTSIHSTEIGVILSDTSQEDQSGGADLYWPLRDCTLEIEENKSFPDMRTPSSVSSLQRSSPGTTSGSCRLPDMRTPSTVSSDLPHNVPTCHRVGSSHFPIPLPVKATSCCRSRDMRTPSTESSDQPRAVHMCHSVRSSHFPLPDKATSCCRLRDMRTPSTESSDQPRNVPTCHSVGSSHLPHGASSCCRLPDMRTPSTISLVIPCDIDTQPSVESSHFPHKTSGCCHFPDMRTPSTISSVLQCKVSGPYGIDWSCLFPSETYSCCHLPALRTRSTESTEDLCDILTSSDSHAPLHVSRQHSGRLRHNMHKYPEPAGPSIHDRQISRYKETHRPCCDCNPSKAREQPLKSMRNEDRTSPAAADYSKKEISMLEHFNHTDPSQRRSIQQCYIPESSATEEDCVCTRIGRGAGTITNEISSQQSKMPKISAREEDCVSQEIKGAGTIIDEITNQQPCNQASQQPGYDDSQQPRYQASQQPHDQASQRPRHPASQQPRHQVSRQSNMPKDSASEQDCICEDIDDTDTITDEITKEQPRVRSNQQPRHQSSWQSNMPKDSASERDCICEYIDNADTITDEITSQQTRLWSSQQPRLQASRKSKTLKFSAVKEDFKSKDIEGPGVVTVEEGSRDQCFQAIRKSKMLNDFAGKKSCECQQKPNDLASYEFCVHQDKEARSRLCMPPEQIQHQPALTVEEISAVLQDPVNTKKSKITKIISSIRKSISHKIYETPKHLGSFKTSKNEAEKYVCMCKEKKPVTLKESEGHKSSKQKSAVLTPKPVTQSPKTIQMKEEKFLCDCKKVKILCKCNGEKLFCDCKEEKVFCGCKEEKLLCDCKEEKVFCECKEDQPKSQKVEKKVNSKSHLTIETMPEPTKPYPQQMPPGAAFELIYDGYPYEHNCGWIDIVELMRLRSELTESTSGFKACKKRKQQQRTNDVIFEEPEAEIELDFEHAIKYYAGKNLELFRDLLPPLESDQEKYQGKKGKKLLKMKRAKAKKEKEKAQKKAKTHGKDSSKGSDEDEKIRLPKESCECPYGIPPPDIFYESITHSPEASEELAKWYPKGIKLCLGGRGLAPVNPAVVSTSVRAGHQSDATVRSAAA